MKEEKVIYLETDSHNPYYNLAFEEYVLCNKKEGDYLLLWQNDNTIVVGQNQNTEAEINRAFVEEHAINVVRRSTGGGAVYHDLGNLNYSFITAAGEKERLNMGRFTAPIVEALKGLGLDAQASGRNDITVSGAKVSGTAQRIAGDRILHHGTLLFQSNPDMVAGALQVDPEKFTSKASTSVRSRIGNIRSFLPAGRDMDLPAFWDYLKAVLLNKDVERNEALCEESLQKSRLAGRLNRQDKAGSFDGPSYEQGSFAGFTYERSALSPAELAAVQKLCDEKYSTWEWNFGRSPKYTLKNKRRWEGGTLEVQAFVQSGKIKEITFYGDFLSRTSLEDLCGAMAGCAFRKEAISEVLERFPLADLFGTITKDEVLQTVFD